MGVGSLLIFFTRAGLMELSNLSGTPWRKHEFQQTHAVVPLVNNNTLKSELVIWEGRSGSASSTEPWQTPLCVTTHKKRGKYRWFLLLNYDTGHVPVNLRFQRELCRQISKVTDFIAAKNQCSHTGLVQSRFCTKPAKSSHFIFFPSKAKWFTLLCIGLKQNAAGFSRHFLLCINCSFPPLLHRQCAFHRRATSHSWVVFAVYSGKFSVRQEISRLRPLAWGKAELWCPRAKYPLEGQRHHRTVDILYRRGAGGRVFLLAKHNRDCVCRAESGTQRMKLEPEAETGKGCRSRSSRSSWSCLFMTEQLPDVHFFPAALKKSNWPWPFTYNPKKMQNNPGRRWQAAVNFIQSEVAFWQVT